MSPNQPGQMPKVPIQGVKNIVAVGSGKGGVGKTTVSVNLSIALSLLGHKVGLMDADVYGPNVPLMMGINRSPQARGERIQQVELGPEAAPSSNVIAGPVRRLEAGE